MRGHVRVGFCPGPTDGSWSTSPTASRAARFGNACSKDAISGTSTIDVVEKTDRLYRNARDWVTLDELGVEIHFIKENVVYSPRPRSSEKFVHGLKVLMAKNFIDNLSEETRKGQQQKAAQGLWPSCAPLGYRNVTGPDGRRVIEPDPDRAPLVTRLFEAYATGRYSLTALTALANAEGLRSRNGRRLAKATIHHMLQTLTYTGAFEWAGTRYRGTHTPLVSLDLWHRVQDRLHGNGRARTRRSKHDFAFSRLIRCGHCRCALVGEIHKGRYVYYRCSGHRGRCPKRYVREEHLAAVFTDLLRTLSFNNDIMDWVAEAVRRTQAGTQAAAAAGAAAPGGRAGDARAPARGDVCGHARRARDGRVLRPQGRRVAAGAGSCARRPR